MDAMPPDEQRLDPLAGRLVRDALASARKQLRAEAHLAARLVAAALTAAIGPPQASPSEPGRGQGGGDVVVAQASEDVCGAAVELVASLLRGRLDRTNVLASRLTPDSPLFLTLCLLLKAPRASTHLRPPTL
ncbi:hypothetical protein MRX96_030261 [Rhipicephalus microplus]